MQKTSPRRRRLWLYALFLLLGALVGVVCWCRTEVSCWYALRGLAGATTDNRGEWIAQVVRIDDQAVHGLVVHLVSPDPKICENAKLALMALTKKWTMNDPRTKRLNQLLVSHFEDLSPHGQFAVLEWQVTLLKQGSGNTAQKPGTKTKRLPKCIRVNAEQLLVKIMEGSRRKSGDGSVGGLFSAQVPAPSATSREVTPLFDSTALSLRGNHLARNGRSRKTNEKNQQSNIRIRDTRQLAGRGLTLELIEWLVDGVLSAECRQSCRQFLETELRSEAPASPLRVINLVHTHHFREDYRLLRSLLPYRHDPDPEIRRAAILAIGTTEDLISADDLLPHLHDSDQAVRELVVISLRCRGLSEDQIALGKLIADGDPRMRLKIIERLNRSLCDNRRQTPRAQFSSIIQSVGSPNVQSSDHIGIQPKVWLVRLLKDQSAAVRCAAVRQAIRHNVWELQTRIEEMAVADLSPTVRDVASEWLDSHDLKHK